MNDYRDCDYFIDDLGDIHIVRGYLHPVNLVRTKLIYKKTSAGDRSRRNGDCYEKNQIDQIIYLPASRIKEYFRPLNNPIKTSLEGLWLDMYNELNNYVAADDIGIFGSSLLDFPVTRDVDFIIYGLDNCRRIKSNIETIKMAMAVPGISTNHINYQSQKFSASHEPGNNTLAKTLANKWCTVQIAPGVSNTLMFGYKAEEIGDWLNADDRPGKDIVVEGEVLDDIRTNFSPRIFNVRDRRGIIFTVKTYYWAYHACVRIGDIVTIAGRLVDRNIILLNNFNHGIAIR
ncbi:MAG: hypothetical protein WC668_00205 [Patescibacteria group bacterium]|jgi:predicted nucleotidyltransferase